MTDVAKLIEEMKALLDSLKEDALEIEGWGAGNEAGRTRQAAGTISILLDIIAFQAKAIEEKDAALRNESDRADRAWSLIAKLNPEETYDDSLLRDIHSRLVIHGKKYPDRAVSVLHRNVVFYTIAAAIRDSTALSPTAPQDGAVG